MDASDVRQLLARIGATVPPSANELEHNGAALVDFIRWYESMPPIARTIEANNPNACKAWASVAHYIDSKQRAASASPTDLLEWHSLNLRLVDMWLLPLTINPPLALFVAALSNATSFEAAFAPVRNMGRLDILVKWALIPSYPLMIVFLDLSSQSRFCAVLFLHFAASFISEALLVFQLLLAYFRGGSKALFFDLFDQTIDHFHARLPYAAATFAFAYFSYHILWRLLPLALIRAPMYGIALFHAVGCAHTAYFVLVEMRAIFKNSRIGPDFDDRKRLRPFNPAILSGATDIIAVRHANGCIRHSAFHVRFGWSSGVFRGGDFVNVLADGVKMPQRMTIASNGVAYFASKSEENDLVQSLGSGKDVVNIRFVPVVTLCGKNITKFISLLVCVEVSTQMHIWKHSDRVVISDIDGTITRSDAAGHVLFWARKWKIPVLSSKEFTHPHVVDLLAAISKRNYKIIYLTARNIGYANQTKEYIHGLKLPGPVVTSHSGLVAALWLEILLKRPDEFKIEELGAIRSLFAPHDQSCIAHEPFYAGLGNRETDTKSYQHVGIQDDRIFIVDKRSRVKVGKASDLLCGYNAVIDGIDAYFPRLTNQKDC